MLDAPSPASHPRAREATGRRLPRCETPPSLSRGWRRRWSPLLSPPAVGPTGSGPGRRRGRSCGEAAATPGRGASRCPSGASRWHRAGDEGDAAAEGEQAVDDGSQHLRLQIEVGRATSRKGRWLESRRARRAGAPLRGLRSRTASGATAVPSRGHARSWAEGGVGPLLRRQLGRRLEGRVFIRYYLELDRPCEMVATLLPSEGPGGWLVAIIQESARWEGELMTRLGLGPAYRWGERRDRGRATGALRRRSARPALLALGRAPGPVPRGRGGPSDRPHGT